jgi:pilus assembly protein Flp/PilA
VWQPVVAAESCEPIQTQIYVFGTKLRIISMRQLKVTAQSSKDGQGVNYSNQRRKGAVTVEYILLITIVGLGALVGLAAVRNSLINELTDLATAIMAITP